MSDDRNELETRGIESFRRELEERARTDAENPTKPRRLTRYTKAAGVSAVPLMVFGVIAIFGSSGEQRDAKSSPALTQRTPAVAASEIAIAESLPQMVATSDYVVEGTVLEIQPGRTLGGNPKAEPVEGETELEYTGALQFNTVSLRVDGLLYGEGLKPGSVIPLEEQSEGDAASGSLVGDHGIYSVVRKVGDDPNFFRLVSSQGRYLEGENGATVASSEEFTWTRALDEMSFEQVRAEVESAAVKAENGEVEPLPVPEPK